MDDILLQPTQHGYQLIVFTVYAKVWKNENNCNYEMMDIKCLFVQPP